MLKKYAIVSLLILFIAFTGDVMAQGIDCVPTPTNPCPPPGAPIDGGGIGLLLVIGIGYAVNKLRNKE